MTREISELLTYAEAEREYCTPRKQLAYMVKSGKLSYRGNGPARRLERKSLESLKLPKQQEIDLLDEVKRPCGRPRIALREFTGVDRKHIFPL